MRDYSYASPIKCPPGTHLVGNHCKDSSNQDNTQGRNKQTCYNREDNQQSASSADSNKQSTKGIH
jgi:hypothetical protein